MSIVFSLIVISKRYPVLLMCYQSITSDSISKSTGLQENVSVSFVMYTATNDDRKTIDFSDDMAPGISDSLP
jgi:hypothetical protein